MKKDVSSGSSSTFTDTVEYHEKSCRRLLPDIVQEKYKQENICLYINGYKIQPGSTVIQR